MSLLDSLGSGHVLLVPPVTLHGTACDTMTFHSLPHHATLRISMLRGSTLTAPSLLWCSSASRLLTPAWQAALRAPAQTQTLAHKHPELALHQRAAVVALGLHTATALRAGLHAQHALDAVVRTAPCLAAGVPHSWPACDAQGLQTL